MLLDRWQSRLTDCLQTSDYKDMETAIKKLTKTYEFATGQIEAAWARKPLKDTVTHYFSNLLGTNPTGLPTNTPPLPSESLKKPDFLPNGALRAHVIRAECCLLMAILYLTQETVVGYLKTGLNLRRGIVHCKFVHNSCSQQIDSIQQLQSCLAGVQTHGSRVQSVHGQRHYISHPIRVGTCMDIQKNSRFNYSLFFHSIGSVHLLLSSLPPKILKIVSAFGWNADKHLGIALLKLCMEGKRIRSPLASIM